MRHCFPISKLPIATSLVTGCSSIGLVIAPVIGGVLIDAQKYNNNWVMRYLLFEQTWKRSTSINK